MRPALSSLECVPSSGIAGSRGNSLLDFLTSRQRVYHGGRTVSHSRQLHTSVPASPHPRCHLLSALWLSPTYSREWPDFLRVSPCSQGSCRLRAPGGPSQATFRCGLMARKVTSTTCAPAHVQGEKLRFSTGGAPEN